MKRGYIFFFNRNGDPSAALCLKAVLHGVRRLIVSPARYFSLAQKSLTAQKAGQFALREIKMATRAVTCRPPRRRDHAGSEERGDLVGVVYIATANNRGVVLIACEPRHPSDGLERRAKRYISCVRPGLALA